MKDRYVPFRCPACGFSNCKGTNIPENNLECRGKCINCSRNVRNIYRHIEQAWGPHGFESRIDCLRFCKGLNADRVIE